MVIDYPVQINVRLRPVGCPWIKITVNHQSNVYQLSNQQNFQYSFQTSDCVSEIVIEHFNKAADDAHTAVEIVGINFFGIENQRFAWAGTYTPDYPEIWYKQQLLEPSKTLSGHTYLGWNGIYRLEFGVPVFEWIHKTLNLGWIYR
jgi:hypothetical protein